MIANTELTFNELLLKRAIGRLQASELPLVGLRGLYEGYDSTSLQILSALNENDNSFEVEQYFNLMLNELGIILPTQKVACLQYIDSIIENTHNNKIGVDDAVIEIVDVLDSYLRLYENDAAYNWLFAFYSSCLDYFVRFDKSWPYKEDLLQSRNEIVELLNTWKSQFAQ